MSQSPKALVFLSLVFFASCGKQPAIQGIEEQKEDNLIISHIKQQDIPVPVGFIPSLVQEEKDILSLCYKGNLNINQSIRFYKQSMELNGWEIQNFSTKKEGLLFCFKESRRCAISIRKDLDSTNLNIMLQNIKLCKSGNPENYIDSINQKQIEIHQET